MNSSFDHLFCEQPFNRIEVNEAGDVFNCCPAWLNKPIGNLLSHSLEDIWNSQTAIQIRESIHNGSYKYCNKNLCPRLKNSEMPKENVKDPSILDLMLNKKSILKTSPTKLNCCYDRSCNLKCASCRTNLIMHKEFSIDWNKASQIQSQLLPLMGHLEWLEVTGSGDPFASTVFFELLKSLNIRDFPRLKIFLHTNATLWTQDRWSQISGIHQLVKKVDISIDAASEKTYQKVRAHGHFQALLNNLKFISGLKKQGFLDDVKLSFVVQSENFHEIPSFVELAKSLQFDRVLFSMLDNWGTFDDETYKAKAIHHPDHPLHSELLAVINKPELDRSFCDFSNLSHLLIMNQT